MEVAPDFERRKFSLQVSMEARRFEIDLLWRRSLSLGLHRCGIWRRWLVLREAAAIRGAVLLRRSRLLLNLDFANRGSRYWHVVWETKVQSLEGSVVGQCSQTMTSHRRTFGVLLRATRPVAL